MRIRTACLAALAAALSSASAFAQTLDELRTGDRVRVRGLEATERGDQRYERIGQLAARDSIRLVIVRQQPAVFDSLPFFAMTDLQVSRGVVPRQKSMLVGAVAGVVTGGALWLIAHHLPSLAENRITNDGQVVPAKGNESFEKVALIATPALTALGFGIGALANSELWVSVRLPVHFPTRP
jgi:hypothetical protein